MSAVGYNLEMIRDVLRRATGPEGKFSQRSLSKEAGESRDCVGDIINGRNKNPTTKVLKNLAEALGGDLSIFGLSEPQPLRLPSEEKLAAMMRGILKSEGLDEIADKHAETLAELLPAALERALAETDDQEAVGPLTRSRQRPRPSEQHHNSSE